MAFVLIFSLVVIFRGCTLGAQPIIIDLVFPFRQEQPPAHRTCAQRI